MTEEFQVFKSDYEILQHKSGFTAETVLIIAVTKRKCEKTKIHNLNIKITLCEIV